MISTALSYRETGLSVLPVKEGKKQPSIPWATYQKNIPGEQQLRTWCADAHGLCILEYSGIHTNTLYDVSSSNSQATPGSGTDAVTSTAPTTTATGDSPPSMAARAACQTSGWPRQGRSCLG